LPDFRSDDFFSLRRPIKNSISFSLCDEQGQDAPEYLESPA
jgi:hypothetical protein